MASIQQTVNQGLGALGATGSMFSATYAHSPEGQRKAEIKNLEKRLAYNEPIIKRDKEKMTPIELMGQVRAQNLRNLEAQKIKEKLFELEPTTERALESAQHAASFDLTEKAKLGEDIKQAEKEIASKSESYKTKKGELGTRAKRGQAQAVKALEEAIEQKHQQIAGINLLYGINNEEAK